jgi:hypothetical protein
MSLKDKLSVAVETAKLFTGGNKGRFVPKVPTKSVAEVSKNASSAKFSKKKKKSWQVKH